ncbi:MAG: hypothetical protein HC809_14605 [Gammaproteobacteria bacterium]|nr:hypothetical protein [Gammaproteobacteria bacterium]
MRSLAGFHPGVDAVLESTILALRGAGAVVVDDLVLERPADYWSSSFEVLLYEFKHSLNAYLARLPAPHNTLDLNGIIAFNRVNAERELVHFGQDILEAANAKGPLSDDAYKRALASVQRAARLHGIDALVSEHRLDVLVSPTAGPAWTIDHVNGDHYLGGSASYPAVAGYPHLTVPMGAVADLPVGLSIYGAPSARSSLFEVGRAVELLRSWRQSPTLLIR